MMNKVFKGKITEQETDITVFIKATAEHTQKLKDISRRVIRNNYTPFLGASLVDGFIDSGIADTEIDNGLDSCLVALLNGEIIGFVITKEDLLHLIMIDVPHQHSGYGSILLKRAESQIFEKHEKVALQSFEENTATNNFYLKNGYTSIETVFVEEIGKSMVSFEK